MTQFQKTIMLLRKITTSSEVLFFYWLCNFLLTIYNYNNKSLIKREILTCKSHTNLFWEFTVEENYTKIKFLHVFKSISSTWSPLRLLKANKILTPCHISQFLQFIWAPSALDLLTSIAWLWKFSKLRLNKVWAYLFLHRPVLLIVIFDMLA